MSRIEVKKTGYKMTYGRDNTIGLFLMIKDNSIDTLVVNKDYILYKNTYTEEEFAEWLVNIADDYSFVLDKQELLNLKA